MNDPIAVFLERRERARAAGAPMDGTIAVLATSERDRPSARFVLVKEVEAEGLFFYTNYESRKASELDATHMAALAIFWAETGVQFRFEGSVERASAARSDAYFATRPRESQIGAWASAQSQPIDSRAVLEARFEEADARFAGKPVPRPPHWGGYRLVPDRIEHWVSGEFRLHDRHLYVRDGDRWTVSVLSP
jgi:pyridoxamine 5'-phosphate oxidase